MKILSGLLIAISLYFGIVHGSRAFSKPSLAYAEMMSSLGIPDPVRFVFGIWAIVAALLILFPDTFFWGDTLRAIQIALMMALVLKAGNYKFAMIEIPFLLLPLLLIYMGHPFRSAILIK
ncbi:hypothetical protein HH214_16440 [Mucilaginibacter robiniae]|uniref:DoxX family protein n=1 Tax=Mucilaginibacter robiniae TaxID=2728022 RepID=A0A7L5E2T3_9SPHI|nr:hypothetical protein [Mucilaginibacter robiniae]QJD97341.1 hypothetical protein HH214_16440 [Mucilaginibacter robiniae]